MVVPLGFRLLHNMEKKRTIAIDRFLYGRIDGYCKSNGLSMTDKCEEWLRGALYKELYGDIPFGKLSSDEVKPGVVNSEPDVMSSAETKAVKAEETADKIEKPIKPTKRRL